MMFRQFLFMALLVANSTFADATNINNEAEVSAIHKTLNTQRDAWNKHDISQFMDAYWQDKHLRFASGGTITYGWQETLERYQKRYASAEAMGTLEFEFLETTVFTTTDAMVFGRWKLIRANDTPQGLFTLQLKKREDAWKIVSDHTSAE